MEQTIKGKRHVIALFKIIDRDEQGRPKTCEMIHGDETTSTEGRPEFMTAWVQKHMVESGN